jgi:hypothetical protein
MADYSKGDKQKDYGLISRKWDRNAIFLFVKTAATVGRRC